MYSDMFIYDNAYNAKNFIYITDFKNRHFKTAFRNLSCSKVFSAFQLLVSAFLSSRNHSVRQPVSFFCLYPEPAYMIDLPLQIVLIVK
jgi:hypothetical protein